MCRVQCVRAGSMNRRPPRGGMGQGRGHPSYCAVLWAGLGAALPSPKQVRRGCRLQRVRAGSGVTLQRRQASLSLRLSRQPRSQVPARTKGITKGTGWEGPGVRRVGLRYCRRRHPRPQVGAMRLPGCAGRLCLVGGAGLAALGSSRGREGHGRGGLAPPELGSTAVVRLARGAGLQSRLRRPSGTARDGAFKCVRTTGRQPGITKMSQLAKKEESPTPNTTRHTHKGSLRHPAQGVPMRARPWHGPSPRSPLAHTQTSLPGPLVSQRLSPSDQPPRSPRATRATTRPRARTHGTIQQDWMPARVPHRRGGGGAAGGAAGGEPCFCCRGGRGTVLALGGWSWVSAYCSFQGVVLLLPLLPPAPGRQVCPPRPRQGNVPHRKPL